MSHCGSNAWLCNAAAEPYLSSFKQHCAPARAAQRLKATLCRNNTLALTPMLPWMTTARSVRPHAHAAQLLVCRLLLAYCGGPWPLLAFLALTWPPRLLCRVARCAFLLAACGWRGGAGEKVAVDFMHRPAARTAPPAGSLQVVGLVRTRGGVHSKLGEQNRRIAVWAWSRRERVVGAGTLSAATSKCGLSTPCPPDKLRASQEQVTSASSSSTQPSSSCQLAR